MRQVLKDTKPAPNRLGEYRRAAGLSQEELANIIGVRPQTIRNAERTRTSHLGYATWGRLADLFGVIDPRILRGEKDP
jgi:DNA-binding XRE family transcriptional regulator